MCIKQCHEFLYAVLDMQDSIADAAKKADDVYRYIGDGGMS